jgi:acyl carrier protein
MTMTMTEDAIKSWLINYLSGLLGVPEPEIDTQTSFTIYGLESGMTMGFVGDFETWLKVELPLEILFEYPTIDALAKHIHENYALPGKSN